LQGRRQEKWTRDNEWTTENEVVPLGEGTGHEDKRKEGKRREEYGDER